MKKIIYYKHIRKGDYIQSQGYLYIAQNGIALVLEKNKHNKYDVTEYFTGSIMFGFLADTTIKQTIANIDELVRTFDMFGNNLKQKTIEAVRACENSYIKYKNQYTNSKISIDVQEVSA